MDEPAGKTFISYSRADADRVLPIVEALRAKGISLWLDQSDIALGKSIAREIDQALDECTSFVAFVGEHYFCDGRHTSEEYYSCLMVAQTEPDWRMITVRLNPNIELPRSAQHRLWVELGDPQETAARLYRSLSGDADAPDVDDPTRSPSPPSRWQDVDADTFSDRDVRAIAREILAQRVERLRKPGNRIDFELDLSLQHSVRFAVLRATLEDPALKIELEHQLHQIDVCLRFITGMKAEILEDGLGKFRIGYEIQVERYAEKSDQAYLALRRHLAGIAGTLHLRAASS